MPMRFRRSLLSIFTNFAPITIIALDFPLLDTFQTHLSSRGRGPKHTVEMAVQEMRDILYENFENYRQGITWDENRRRPFEALGGNAPVIHNVVNANVRQLPIYLANGGKVNIDTVEDLVGLQNSIKAAHNGLQRLKKYIMSRSNAERFVYQRCLGWGGFGLATVFDVRDEDGQRIRGVVVKMLLDNDEKLLKEEIDACMSLLHLYTTSLMMHVR